MIMIDLVIITYTLIIESLLLIREHMHSVYFIAIKFYKYTLKNNLYSL